MKNAALITGSARRIGRALAIFLASKHECDIVAHYHSSHDDALSLQDIVQKSYRRKCVLVQADLGNFASLKKIMKQSFTAMPHLNILINNASVFYEDSLEKCSLKCFTENHNIHVRAPVFLTQYFARMCKQGKVINVVDANVKRTSTSYFSYLLSKKSLVDFTALTASEFDPRHLCITAVCPTKIPAHEIDGIQSVENLTDKPQLKNFLDIVDHIMDFNQLSSGKILFMDK
ncbi:SDR family NAD(P)-dependent oxidoreductase [Anaplasma platys]|uniref:SDR family NAD(P)-dependent oxidoreductase n=1 Tax=Anaplasma platys TaxID=949 RepID=A0A858PXA5_9RICK|nr:SDR family NAD(P)-dependent oxidoreductase [Anaplasma platys]QJC27210.1 SDR family NAD(P)-dependent oxidoreductase [Anaplasma platys]